MDPPHRPFDSVSLSIPSISESRSGLRTMRSLLSICVASMCSPILATKIVGRATLGHQNGQPACGSFKRR